MKLETDDEIYRAKLVYLGPPGYSLPFHLSYAQYGVFAVILIALVLVGVLVFASLVVIGPCVAIALGLTHTVFQYVDPDQPARAVAKTFFTDWRRMGSREGRVPALAARHIKIRTEITEPADGGDR